MNEVPFERLLGDLDPQFAQAIRERAATLSPGKATHVVLFQNVAFDSSHFGEQSVLFVGPGCDNKTPQDLDGRWLNDLPSMRQYAQCYAALPEAV